MTTYTGVAVSGFNPAVPAYISSPLFTIVFHLAQVSLSVTIQLSYRKVTRDSEFRKVRFEE
jgi:hypothetical protein